MLARMLCHLLLGFSISAAADPPFPDWPIEPKKDVIPAPMPRTVTLLSAGELYVVQGDGTEQLLSSPPGVVEITEKAGPLAIYSKFVDSNGKEEFRDYSAKQVFLVKRLVKGQVELIKVPKGKTERRLLSDNTPPPDPEPDPKPKPDDPKPDPKPTPTKTLRVIFAVESGDTMTTAQAGVVYGAAVENWCVKNCTGGRAGLARRDRNNPNVAGVEMQEIWKIAQAAATATPFVAVERNGHIEIIVIEDSPEKMVAVFEEYLQGKRGNK